MDLLGCYSKRTFWTKRMQRLLDSTPSDQAGAVRQPRATVVPLSAAEVAALVDGYRAGASINELATRCGIHRTTVTQHLHRSGAPIRHRGLDDKQIDRAVHSYQHGHSLTRIGARLGVHAETVRQALRARGVQMRKAWERA